VKIFTIEEIIGNNFHLRFRPGKKVTCSLKTNLYLVTYHKKFKKTVF